MKWFIGINALRFYAIVLILIYHLFRTFLPGGFIAVDIFFAISGFLIGSKLIHEFAANRKIKYWKFILSRIVHLAPLLLACVVGTLLLTFLINPDILAGARLNTLAALTFTTNLKELVSGGAYENTISPNLFEHTWFIALEMQLYLLTPLIVTFVMGSVKNNKTGAKVLAIFSAALAIFSMVLMAVYGGVFEMADRAYFAIDSHIGAYSLGLMLAAINYVRPRTPRTKKTIPTIGVALSLAVITFMAIKFNFNDSLVYFVGLPLTGVLTIVMIYCIIKLQPNIHIRHRIALPVRAMEKLGTYSYGVYLFHWPLTILLPNLLASRIEPIVLLILNLLISFFLTWFAMKIFDRKRFASKFRLSGAFRNFVGLASAALIISCALALVRIPNVSSITEQLNSMRDEEISQQTSTEVVDYIGAVEILEDTKAAMLVQLSTEAKVAPESNSQPIQSAPDVDKARVLVIGDSVTLGAKQALESTVNGVYVDARESRGIWTARNILVNYGARGRLPDVIVISLITNEATITDGLLQGIIESAGRNHEFIFVTGYAGVQQPREVQNAALKAFAESRENVMVVDWWAVAHDNWSLMYADHIHLNPDGRVAYANLINAAVRSLKK